MSLAVGQRIGAFEITGLLGAGGMGEVYRATDTKLKRQVAIKILPEAVAGDGERLARFRREAEVLASLNHPNIAAIYGFEDASGIHALVLELVKNGTFVSDRRIDSATRLVDGASIRVGSVRLTFTRVQNRGSTETELGSDDH